MRRVRAREASYTGPLRTLLAWAAAVARARRARRRVGAGAGGGATPGAAPAPPTPGAAGAAATRLRLPVTLRGLHVTVQARSPAAAAAAAAAAAGAATPGAGALPASPPPAAADAPAPATPVTPQLLRSSSSLHARRRLLAAGRWRLLSGVSRLLDVTLLDVRVTLLPPERDAADVADGPPAPALSLRLDRVALTASAPGGAAALRLAAHATGAALRLRPAPTAAGDDAGGDASTKDGRDASGAAAASSSSSSCHHAAIAALSWLELVAEVEHDALAGTTRCARLEADGGAAAAALNADVLAALRCAGCAGSMAARGSQVTDALLRRACRLRAPGVASAAAAPSRGAATRLPGSTALRLESLSLSLGSADAHRAAGVQLQAAGARAARARCARSGAGGAELTRARILCRSLAALQLCCHAPVALRAAGGATELLLSADCTDLSVSPHSSAAAAAAAAACASAAAEATGVQAAPAAPPFLRAARLGCEGALPLPAEGEGEGEAVQATAQARFADEKRRTSELRPLIAPLASQPIPPGVPLGRAAAPRRRRRRCAARRRRGAAPARQRSSSRDGRDGANARCRGLARRGRRARHAARRRGAARRRRRRLRLADAGRHAADGNAASDDAAGSVAARVRLPAAAAAAHRLAGARAADR